MGKPRSCESMPPSCAVPCSSGSVAQSSPLFVHRVKYAEGSYDEDYIQTLGEYGTRSSQEAEADRGELLSCPRRQLYGKDSAMLFSVFRIPG